MPATREKYFTVKQAAKILGYSTNSIYKFCNNGRLKASRGQSEQGRFRIPKKSLDDFFGATIPQAYIDEKLTPPPPKRTQPEIIKNSSHNLPTGRVVTNHHPSPTSTPTNLKIARILILACLAGVIADVLLTNDFALLPQILRLALIGVIVLITYQFEDYHAKQN